jgi:hypothetical protein
MGARSAPKSWSTESQCHLVCSACSDYNRLPGYCRNDPDADQNPPASRDGYSDQHPDQHANTYQHGHQHPCADANSEPHGHSATDGHACARADRHAAAYKYASSGSYADPCGTSHRYACASTDYRL